MFSYPGNHKILSLNFNHKLLFTSNCLCMHFDSKQMVVIELEVVLKLLSVEEIALREVWSFRGDVKTD